MSLIQKANKSQVWLKGNFAGASGSGKTMSALRCMAGLLGGYEKIVVIDTENGSANLYDHLGDYSVLPFDKPFAPSRYVSAIQMCVDEGFEGIIIDSVSHEWDGPGGILEIHQKFGGKFQDWAKTTPLHNAFINAILQAKAHVFTTNRKKSDYAIENINGKTKVSKVGTKDIQRDGYEFEMSFSFNIDENHLAVASKDRTGLFTDPVPFMITEETGEKLREWNKGDKNPGETAKDASGEEVAKS